MAEVIFQFFGSGGADAADANPLTLGLTFIALAVLPFLLLATTSFIKLSVVFGILRNALGAQQVPSAAVTSLLALVLTVHIMSPVAEEVAAEFFAKPKKEGTKNGAGDNAGDDFFAQTARAGVALEKFLRKHSHLRERVFFAGIRTRRHLSRDSAPSEPAGCAGAAECVVPGEDILSLVPSFVISELKEAFSIGFLIFLPFLVIDLVVANLLVGLGMMMVSPVTISLPFKIILFVIIDGWFLLCRGLVLGYG